MKINIKLLFSLVFFTIILGQVQGVYASWVADPNAPFCSRERSDSRCNDDSDCCPGKHCSAFNFCEYSCCDELP